MISLGGTIGTGYFLASGGAIHSAGPGGAILAYAIIGIMVYFLMTWFSGNGGLYACCWKL